MVFSPGDREAERLPLELRVGYQRLATFMRDYTANFSRGGMFIKSIHPLATGTRCIFKIGLPGFDEPLELLGEVTWRNTMHVYQNPKVLETGMGIRFIFSSESEREELARFVDEMIRPKLKASA
ncbi:MAG: TIGR02266 family protein [Deltaproteobacteria bacterium]|jgi:uncharacterized protein (TIGR02266 family)|nr:TIGR02266 family protein [Deltaproteobacteria bacterium]MBT6490637.1 TIGR02266 family protein [Deltaproteobacteria bacterium]